MEANSRWSTGADYGSERMDDVGTSLGGRRRTKRRQNIGGKKSKKNKKRQRKGGKKSNKRSKRKHWVMG